ncbi:MAG: hypothetical protein KAU16_07680 [Methanophagales archaeon]|nr:hypothetical protein [Methanophagales archaeon]
MVWEQRGNWSKNTIGKICAELDIIHCVDPFVGDPVTPGFAYFRLHGLPAGEKNVSLYLHGG